MRRLLFILPVLLFLALAGYFWLALRPGYDPRALPSALLNKEAPDFNLARLNGDGTLSLASLRGHPVLINFFASWCIPCRIEQPILMRLANQEHLPLYGINYEDKPADAAKLLASLGDPYRAVGLDPKGRTGLNFGVYGVPETFVLDRDGHIRKRFAGPLTAEQVEQELLPLLKSLGAS
jgi:cytochrome c biogenesis protein CcmG, thiol:disulfide interchange protein DsbE